MNEETKLTALDVLQDRIRATLSAHTQTNDTTTIEMVGVLEMVKMDLYQGELEDE